jgi:hypothetical protein
MALVLMKACHWGSLSRVCWREETDLDMALGREEKEEVVPFAEGAIVGGCAVVVEVDLVGALM